MTENRRRLTGLTLTAGLLGIVIGAAAVWMVAGRNEPPRAAPPQPPEGAPPQAPEEAAPQPSEGRPVLASGVIAGDRWELRLSHDEEVGWCIIVTRGPGTSSYCSFDTEKNLDVKQGLGLAFGTVTKKAFFLEAKGSNRRRMAARIIETPLRLDLPFNIVVALPGPNQPGDIGIKAFNSHGNGINRGRG
jgi:hypothetical protein